MNHTHGNGLLLSQKGTIFREFNKKTVKTGLKEARKV